MGLSSLGPLPANCQFAARFLCGLAVGSRFFYPFFYPGPACWVLAIEGELYAGRHFTHSCLVVGFAVAEAIKSRRHEVFFLGKNSGGTTLVYLPIDNWARRRRGLFPPRRTAGGVRRRRRCCFARMHASAIVHHHRWDAMRCHAMHARLRPASFHACRLHARTGTGRGSATQHAAASHTCIAPISLARAYL